jgi:Protein of unknown function (DUF3047)
MKKRILKIFLSVIAALAILVVAGWLLFRHLTSPPSPVNPVIAGNGPSVTLMDFATPPTVTPITLGWWHIGFLTKPKMNITFPEKDGVKSLRCETAASGSIFGRHTDIDLAQYPNLVWDWQIEKPVISTVPETEWAGDDHPARFLIHVLDSEKSEHYFEIIWSNGAFKPGQWKIIGSFHHYVANGGDAKTGENTGKWFNEKVNLLDLYHTATGRSDGARLINIAVFCDTDDTKTQSVAYFGKVELLK